MFYLYLLFQESEINSKKWTLFICRLSDFLLSGEIAMARYQTYTSNIKTTWRKFTAKIWHHSLPAAQTACDSFNMNAINYRLALNPYNAEFLSPARRGREILVRILSDVTFSCGRKNSKTTGQIFLKF